MITPFFFQAEDGLRDVERSRGLGDVYKRQLQPQFATDITEELAVDLLSHLHILQHTLLQQLQSARARRNAAGGYNGGWAVEAAMDRTGAIIAP